jgi:YegS/Rv2252/BmrU family lipid kinase
VLSALDGAGCTYVVRETTGPGDALRFAREALDGGCDLVVAAGGDGTVNEVINGLGGAPLPLAIVPLGTANVLAAEIGLRTDPEAVARTIAQGEPRPVSLGQADGRRFLLMAGAGFDAHVVQGVSVPLKRWLGKGAYVYASLRQLLAFPFRQYRVRVDGVEYRAASVVIANGRHYAGRHLCAPAADLGHPTLEVCLFERSGRLAVVVYALALLTGRLPRLKSLRIVSGRRIEIAGRPGEPLQGDGDVIGQLDTVIEVLPEALRLVFPPPAAAAALAPAPAARRAA